jgi:hypothetical protein
MLLRRTPSVDDIRDAALARGWRFQRHPDWSGGRTAFELEGSTRDGTVWVLDSFNVGIKRNWTVGLKLRFPALAGEWDFAVLPRERPGRGREFGDVVPNLGADLARFDNGGGRGRGVPRTRSRDARRRTRLRRHVQGLRRRRQPARQPTHRRATGGTLHRVATTGHHAAVDGRLAR